MDTESERQRIKKAFRNDPETRRRLTLLMDAIEAMDWEKANRMLSDKWWQGRDEKCECSRLEFVGMADFRNPKMAGHSADGFDRWAEYGQLVYMMSHKQEKGGVKYSIEKM
jgi:hypothetical protein